VALQHRAAVATKTSLTSNEQAGPGQSSAVLGWTGPGTDRVMPLMRTRGRPAGTPGGRGNPGAGGPGRAGR